MRGVGPCHDPRVRNRVSHSCALTREGFEFGHDFFVRRVRHGAAVREHDGGNRLISSIGVLDEVRGFGVDLYVDLGEGDIAAHHLRLEPLAVAAPYGAEHHDRTFVGGEIVHNRRLVARSQEHLPGMLCRWR